MKYRSRTEIVATMLEAANGGATKTKIMYRAFLSHPQLKEYVSVLMENGLLDYDEGAGLLKTTTKGFKFLGIYSQLDTLAPRRRPNSELSIAPKAEQ